MEKEKCNVFDCDHEARYEAVIKAPPHPLVVLKKEKETAKPAEITIGIKVCKEHTNLTAYDILTEKKATEISLEIFKAGGVQIDKQNLEIEWRKIE